MTPRIIDTPPSPGTTEWRRIISASKVPAILGIDPYKTTGQLWMEMSGLAEPEAPDDTTRDMWAWGHAAEPSLAQWWREKNPGWQLNKGGEIAYTNPGLPFPNLATLDRRPRRGRAYHRLELKTSISRTKWGDIGDPLPGDVTTQTIFQAGVSDIEQGSVVALIGYDQPMIPRIYDAPADPDVFAGLVDVCADFYRSLGEHEPPMPDPALIEGLNAARWHAPTEGEADAPEDLVDELRRTAAVLAEAQSDHDQSKQALLDYLGNRQTLRYQGRVLASPTKGRFSQKNIPKEAQHLLADPDVLTPKFDATKFAAKYPDLYAAATSSDTMTIREKALSQ